MSTLSQNNTAKGHRIYGGPGDQAAASSVNTAGQTVAEALTVGTNARRFKGPARNAHCSIHWFNATPSGATSTMTVSYSNLPDPDPTNDAHWGPTDAGITAVDMTTTATGSFININNGLNAEWVRLKPNAVTTAGSAWCFVRVEGVEV